MNESQERREELLRMSRQKWRKGSIPAVHPRYQHVYRGLYGEHSSEENGGSSFFARMFISFLIFGMFVAADYTGEKIWKYTPSQIVSQIEYQPDIMTGNWSEKIGKQFYGGDGLVEKGVENTIRNIGELAKKGMRETDKTIIQIMTR